MVSGVVCSVMGAPRRCAPQCPPRRTDRRSSKRHRCATMSHGTRPRRAEVRSGDRHTVAVVMVEGTLVLDMAVALQAFGPRPTRVRQHPRRGRVALRRRAVRAAGHRGPRGWRARRPDGAVGAASPPPTPSSRRASTRPAPGGSPEVLEAIQAAAANGARLVSLCAGAFLFGHAGVLDGHRVTTHWALADEFRAPVPRRRAGRRRAVRRRRPGPQLGRDAGGHRPVPAHPAARPRPGLRQRRGPPAGQPAAPHRRPGAVPQRSRRRPGGLARRRCSAWALEHLDEELTLPVLAAKAHLSTRTLSRRFEVETGRGALQWIAERRVERARMLLEDTR